MLRPPTYSAGFTLLELMLTVTVAAVLIGIGAPAFNDTIRNNRLTAGANDLLRSMHLARSEAIKRQTNVVVCASANANATVPTCSGGAFNQWIVFVDVNGNWDADGMEPLIEQHDALAPSVTVRNDGKGVVSYAATGFSTPPPTGTAPSTRIVICDDRGNQQIGGNSTARAVVIEKTGRSRVAKSSTDVTAAIGVAGACPQ